jgi:hypothetical protein
MAVPSRAPQGAEHGSAPVFFLSYARHHRVVEDKSGIAEDPDRWTLRFFDDLTFEVAELTALPRHARPGFMDRELRVGQEWPRRISEALAACRVFVPLYTPRYFTSLSCASEWYLFQARQSAHELNSGTRPEAIIPVLWLPMPDTELPPAAQALQFDHHTLGEAYARLGFLQLIRLARFKDEYQLAIHALAREVVRVALSGAPQAAQPVDFTWLRGRFENAEVLFDAARELVRRVGGRRPLSLPGRRPLALPPGTAITDKRADPLAAPLTDSLAEPEPGPAPSPLPGPVPDRPEDPRGSADEAVIAYVRAAQAKLTEWFASRPHQIASSDFDDFYFREVHPAAKAALVRHLTPHAPDGPSARPPRLRSLPTAERPQGGAPDVL